MISLNYRGRVINKYDKRILRLSLLIFLIGILSSLWFSYVSDFTTIAKDIVLTFKFPLGYVCAMFTFGNYRSRVLGKNIICIAKIMICIIFAFGCISLFVNLGMSGEVRSGIKSYRFLYTHYTYLVYNTILLMSTLLCEKKKNFCYYIMATLILLLTMRTKAFVFVGMFWTIKLIGINKINSKEKLKKLKWQYILIMLVIAFIIAKPKLQDYLSWGFTYNLRNGLYYKGLLIAMKCFPLGSGFGTFGTNISLNTSPLYYLYGLYTYQGFDQGNAFASDVYWPSIYAQFGFIGCALYVWILVNIIKSIIITQKNHMNQMWASLILIIYMTAASFAEATFSNEIGVFSVVVILLFNSSVYGISEKEINDNLLFEEQ
jgi:hypothetical protein